MMLAGTRSTCGPVLVVDDDPDVREALAEAITRTGRSVLMAGDGSEALSVLDAGTVRPCVVLLDWMMAPMDGGEFLEHVKTRDLGELRVVVVSANTHLVPKAVLPGLLGTLRKPFALEELLSVLDRHC
jgi:CheY-like chemotaxis protein